MKAKILAVWLSAGFAVSAAEAGDDACATRVIETSASVAVSNGRAYETRSLFRSKSEAAIDFINGETTTIALEGPFAWTRGENGAALAGDREKGFAIGHQFHALLLHFDEIFDGTRSSDAIAFRGRTASGRSGGAPDGGKAHLILSPGGAPEGMKFQPADQGPIEIEFSDWREADGRTLPWIVTIHDGDDVYTYRYNAISISDQSPLHFYEQAGATGLDEIDIYRLHRRMLAAHCLGDAALMARLTAPEGVVANRGDLFLTTRAQLLENMTGLFERLDYQSYEDLAEPFVEVSPGGDMGWIGVKVRASGAVNETGEPFESDWAWIMLVKKLDGEWLNAGNASNQKPQ